MTVKNFSTMTYFNLEMFLAVTLFGLCSFAIGAVGWQRSTNNISKLLQLNWYISLWKNGLFVDKSVKQKCQFMLTEEAKKSQDLTRKKWWVFNEPTNPKNGLNYFLLVERLCDEDLLLAGSISLKVGCEWRLKINKKQFHLHSNDFTEIYVEKNRHLWWSYACALWSFSETWALPKT